MNRSRSILVVDDDREICELLSEYLGQYGFQVATAESGKDFQQQLKKQAVDLLILDVSLPDNNGFNLCRWVRAHSEFLNLPVIMLTASSDESDRVVGLEIGADDYLGKPFSPRELLARVNALLRRSSITSPPPNSFSFGDWLLNINTRRLIHNTGTEVILTGSEFALLKLFVTSPHQIIDRATIGREVLGRELPQARNVDMAVSRLRQKLSDNEKPHKLILSVRGEGYVLATAVSKFNDI